MALAAEHLRAPRPLRGGVRRWLATLGLVAGLAAIVALRWVAVASGAPSLGVGLGFAAALLLLWAAAARGTVPAAAARGTVPAAANRRIGAGVGRPVGRRALLVARPRTSRLGLAVAAGAAFGLLLVGATIGGASLSGVTLPPGLSRPAAPFLPWALVVIAVAAAEEGILRGVLFDRLRAHGGLVPAIAVTTVTFALLHVPVYGWHVVPLDLAVGLRLAGLRLGTRTVAAPAVAHAVADLATWWL